ncbi:MAG TPA: DoxX family protein [Actinomycetota bacterium]|nr:DoxX family protein [Actinomycetota bacterium]
MAIATTDRKSEVEIAPYGVTALKPEVPEVPEVKGARIWAVLRISIGWVFLWSFLDKLFALGFTTGRAESGAIDFFGPAAWINGGSPTEGFLQFGVHTKGFLVDFYQGLAGGAWVDWVFMLSLLFIGLGLIFGIATRLAAIGGIVWMAILYSASAVWPEHNPFMDEHVIYAIVLAGVAYVGAGRYFGFGRWWEQTALVKRAPFLK